MARLQYIARSHLAPGHVVGGQYSIEFKATKVNVTADVNSSQLKSIGGYTETTLFDAREKFSITTQPQTAENSAFFREALFSMLDGQKVSIDLTDTGDDVPAIRAVMIGVPRFTRKEGARERFSFSFVLRVEE